MTDKHLLYWVLLALKEMGEENTLKERIDLLNPPTWVIQALEDNLEQLKNKS